MPAYQRMQEVRDVEKGSSAGIDIQDFIAVSARYLGLRADVPVAHADWDKATVVDGLGADRPLQRLEASDSVIPSAA